MSVAMKRWFFMGAVFGVVLQAFITILLPKGWGWEAQAMELVILSITLMSFSLFWRFKADQPQKRH